MRGGLACWIAYWLPRSVARWAFIRVATYASVMKPGKEMPDITCVEALRSWEDHGNGS